MSEPLARSPRAEATARLAEGYEARVLEPSPPASTDPDWYADDPTDPSGGAATVVSPVSDGDLTWDEYVADHPEVAAFARRHWLGNLARLEPAPPGYVETRVALHQLAFFALSPTRHRANGKMALRYTHRGFGTPFYGDDEQARVEADLLVLQTGDKVRWEPITTIRAATELYGIDYVVEWFPGLHDPPEPLDPDMRLSVDPSAAEALGDWFGFAYAVLEEARRLGRPEDEVSRVQLWPEHFDPAFEMGEPEKGERASYGASPGDVAHPEPYLYVAPWSEVDRADPFWNAESFNGAFLGYQQLLDAADQRRAALEFLASGYRRLTS